MENTATHRRTAASATVVILYKVCIAILLKSGSR
jgi:hypothetical protein